MLYKLREEYWKERVEMQKRIIQELESSNNAKRAKILEIKKKLIGISCERKKDAMDKDFIIQSLRT